MSARHRWMILGCGLLVALAITVTRASASEVSLTSTNISFTLRCSSCGAGTPLTLEQADVVDVQWFLDVSGPAPFHINEGDDFGPKALDRGDDHSVEFELSAPDGSSEQGDGSGGSGGSGIGSDSDHHDGGDGSSHDSDGDGLHYTAALEHHDGQGDGDQDNQGDGDHSGYESVSYSAGGSNDGDSWTNDQGPNGGSHAGEGYGPVGGGTGAGSGSGGGAGQTLVPEPASLLLFGTGLSALVYGRRRKTPPKTK